MSTRLFLLKIAATLAALLAGGCVPQLTPFVPQPSPQTNLVPAARVELIVSGEGKVSVGGDASITAKSAAPSADGAVCLCGCGLEGCTCGRGASSAAQTANTAARSSGPQFVSQYRDRVVCENGVCRKIREEVQGPVAAVSPPERTAATGGKITVFVQRGNPACEAMREALRGVKGIDFQSGTPPAINGQYWWPTAVKSNGAAWTPGAGGWHAGSVSQFNVWRQSP